MDFLTILIILALIAVLGTLITGIISMFRGGEFNEKYGNKLMQMRVIIQFIAVILIGLAFLFRR
jgi:nitrogen fixation/metabolism regulation signal transduction histidine kinase